MLVDFCLPVKNEELILSGNCQRIFSYLKDLNPTYNWRLVILINGSNDNSYQIALKFTELYPNNCLAFNYPFSGKSAAIKKYFSDSQADILAFMDADLAVSLLDIPKLINPILKNEADLVIGSRFKKKSLTKRPLLDSIRSRAYNFLAHLFLGIKVSDLQCGFKALKKDLFNSLKNYLKDDKWFFDTELISLSIKFNYRLQEIPVNWMENRFYRRKSQVKKSEPFKFFLKLLKFKKYLNEIKK